MWTTVEEVGNKCYLKGGGVSPAIKRFSIVFFLQEIANTRHGVESPIKMLTYISREIYIWMAPETQNILSHAKYIL